MVTWKVTVREDGSRHLALEWRESELKLRNSSDTEKRRFGRRMIEEGLPYQLDAKTQFAPFDDGMLCSIEMPLGYERRAGGDDAI
jgi:two-component system CheB/CheR fusion protein